MPLIIGAKSATATYTVDNSCRFNPGDDPTLTIASLGTPTDQNKWTFSAWLKRGRVASENGIMRMYADDNDYTTVNVSGAGQLEFDNKVSSSFDGRRMTTAKYLDPAAWYHYVMVYDSDNVTGDDRMITYVNGTRITALDTDNDPGSGTQSGLGSGNTMTVGIGGASGTAEWGGYLAEVALCDGQAYAASDFGEFDSDSPTIWKPIDISGLTFGDNGFYLDFKDSADLGADVSGNSNDFTVANLDATDQATDTPTNNFATFNALSSNNPTLSGESLTATASGGYRFALTTIAPTTGKYYAEFKLTTATGYTNFGVVNISKGSFFSQYDTNSYIGDATAGNGAAYQPGSSAIYHNGSTSGSYGSAVSGDIIGIAMDLDYGFIYWSKNGTFLNSGDPTSAGTGTGGYAISNIENSSGANTYAMGVSLANTGGGRSISANFGGSPAFTVASGNADANGYGNFEYAPPSGYYALCTKNLGEFG